MPQPRKLGPQYVLRDFGPDTQLRQRVEKHLATLPRGMGITLPVFIRRALEAAIEKAEKGGGK